MTPLALRQGRGLVAVQDDLAQVPSVPLDRVLGCDDAAALLDVSPTALRAWSERLAFPCDVGDGSGPRFRRNEIEALRDALPDAHSVTGAIHAARMRVHA
ncbi:hypothetical protein Q5424_09670 [Conexibacter sp. JD483]|uniref:hypothetical protein n=1 Tax=unclassified Conexibacter TaxID=2627773 RepID=UPI0027221E0D|nr:MULTISPECIES: hypothetical protein [unclassified Conexibacter]MDO8185438.1 hypothetical protein [Conexibacter sp. CPCC 205706]MDO8198386.1 hypothetical protein [Conexibacter sp. CPCC 205762]MDR9369348.1 hypothetical protein [Conexibacter sp. JD483]